MSLFSKLVPHLSSLVSKRPKVVIIGLDGVPYSLLKSYSEQGIMPNFKSMITEGSFYKMETSLPEVSSVAWTSFMTGKDPGEHGIFGFMELKDGTYDMYFPNFSDVKSPTFWESSGLPSVVLNIPQTYPAKPLNGIMTSGFVALDLKKATYPEKAYNYLNSIGYKIDVNANLARDNIPAFFEDLSITFEKRKEAIRHFFKNGDWQIFIGTITETDRLHHFFFHNALNDGEFHERFVDFYKELDNFLAEMYEKAKKQNALFMTCSDHGFTPIKTEVYLNNWLIEEGYLEIADKEKGVETITEKSRAFCLDPSRIYIHLEGKYPRGSVKKSKYQDLRNELAQKIKSLPFNGESIVKAVYFKEDIFNGPHADKGPDIYVLPNYGFDLKGAFNRESIFGTTHFKGMHTHDDAHLFLSDKLSSSNFKIEDIAGIVSKHIQ